MYVYVHIYVYMYTVYIYMYVYIYIIIYYSKKIVDGANFEFRHQQRPPERRDEFKRHLFLFPAL